MKPLFLQQKSRNRGSLEYIHPLYIEAIWQLAKVNNTCHIANDSAEHGHSV